MYPVGVEGYSSVGIGAGCTVFKVTLDRAAHCGKLAADLVMPSGEKLDFDQGVAVRVSDDFVSEAGQFGSGSLFSAFCYEALVHALVPDQPVFQQA